MKQTIPVTPKITFSISKIRPIHFSLNNEEDLEKNKEELIEISCIQTKFNEQEKLKLGIEANQTLSILNFLEQNFNSINNNNINNHLYIEIERNDSFEIRNSDKVMLYL